MIIVLVAVLLPLLVAQASIYYVRYQDRQAHELQSNLEVAGAVANAFDAYVQDILHAEYAVGLALTGPTPLTLDEMNSILAGGATQHAAVRGLSWLDPQARVVASSQPESIGFDASDRSYLQEIMKGREWALGPVVQSRTSGLATITLSRGVRDESGNLSGIVSASIDPDRLGEVLRVTRSGQAALLILDSEGRTVYRYPELSWTPELRRVYLEEPAVRRARAAGEAVSNMLWGADDQRAVGRIRASPLR